MNKQKVPAYILLVALICLGVFVDAPVISREVKVPCYVDLQASWGVPLPII